MSKIIAERITMGFTYPEPKSEYFGYFKDEKQAFEWAKKKNPTFTAYTENEDGENFLQKDMGVSVVEIYFRDVENEGFLDDIECCKMLERPYFTEDKMVKVEVI